MRFRPAALASLALVSALTCGGLNAPAGAATPAGFQAHDGADGGHIVAGPIGGATSATDLMRSALKRVRGIVGGPPDVLGATRSTDNTLTVTLFRANRAGTPIGGLVLTTFVRGGVSRAAIVYDDADRFASTAPSLIAQASIAPPSASGGAPAPALHAVVAQDGSVHAMIPAGWRVPIFAQGQFGAMGPNGEEVDQEVSAQLADPRSPAFRQWVALQQQIHQPINPLRTPYGIPLEYVADPARAFTAFSSVLARYTQQADPAVSIESAHAIPDQPGPLRAASIAGTQTVKGVRMRFQGVVAVAPPGQGGGWMISVKMVSAPVARFAAALPTLVAVYNSYNVDQNVRGQQVQQTIADDRAGAAHVSAVMQQTQAQNTATFNASMQHARSVQDSIDRSTAGFTRYLNGTTVLESSSGARGSIDDNFAASIVRDDPEHFRVVPVSEYRKGIDY